MEKLRIYQISLELVAKVYLLIRRNRNLSLDWSLCDQLKRAAVSISANIAEGYLRSKKQFKNYLKIASGSANEMVALLQIVNKVYGVETSDLQEGFRILARQIGAFSRNLRT